MGIEQGSNLQPTTDTMNTTLTLIQNLEGGSLLTPPQAESLMEELLSGRIDTTEIVRMLQALNSRPADAGELASFARVMRQHAALVFPPGVALPEKMVDTCGTGGDGSGTFNISTAAAIVASAAGARVAKHGNRAVQISLKHHRVAKPRAQAAGLACGLRNRRLCFLVGIDG
jgi:anthranilate phosphoribosyltransferase